MCVYTVCMLLPFIRTSQPSRHFIYCIYGSLSDSPVYIKPVYFHPSLWIIPELQQRSPVYWRYSVSPLPYVFYVMALSFMDELYEMWEPVCLCGKIINLSVSLLACLWIVVQQRDRNQFRNNWSGTGKAAAGLPGIQHHKKKIHPISPSSSRHLDDWSSPRERWMEESVEEIVFERCCNDSHGDSTRHAPLPPMVRLCPCQGHCESIFKWQNSVCRALSTWPQS